MCIVIDACCANSLADLSLQASKSILTWVSRGGKIVTGGKLEQELSRTSLKKLLVEWKVAGKLVNIDKNTLNTLAQKIEADGCRSNDSHVIALVKASASKLVITNDLNLSTDLKSGNHCHQGVAILPIGSKYKTSRKVCDRLLGNANCRS